MMKWKQWAQRIYENETELIKKTMALSRRQLFFSKNVGRGYKKPRGRQTRDANCDR